MTDWPEDNKTVQLCRAKTALCREIEDRLQPLFPSGVSLDLEICVRDGNIRIMPKLLHKGRGWKDRSGG